MVTHSRSTNSFVIFFIILSSSICISGFLSTIAFGDKKAITLTLDKSSYAPLTNIHGNQLSVSVRYQFDDKSPDVKINGLMKIYSSNGTLIHSTSFPDGFNAKKKGGVEELKTTIRDPTLEHVIANVTFTDLKKTETLSNTVTAKLDLNQTSSKTTNSTG
ncbi:MAG: hypothetical protein WBP74_04215, partial [Nitrososphaeraceae archaeon]